MSNKKIVRARFAEQGGRCVFCHKTTWLRGIETERQARLRLGDPGKPLSRGDMHKRMATASRLRLQHINGKLGADITVMACHECSTGPANILRRHTQHCEGMHHEYV